MDYKSIAQKIIELKNADLELRDRLVQNGQLGGGYNEQMKKLYNRNAETLNEIIDTIGYPTIDWSYGSTREYFDNSGKLLKNMHISFVDSLGKNTSTEYQYDESGNLILQKLIYENYQKVKQVFEDKYVFKYDSNGNWTEKKLFDEDSLTLTTRRDIIYY